MSTTQAPKTFPGLTDEQLAEAERTKAKLEQIENDAPRYDVEYHVSTPKDTGLLSDWEGQVAMAAYGMLNSDLDNQIHVPIRTTVDKEHSPEGVVSVMITVAVESKRMVFDEGKAEWSILVDPREKHWMWCCKDYETETEPTEELPEYEFEEYEKEFLR